MASRSDWIMISTIDLEPYFSHNTDSVLHGGRLCYPQAPLNFSTAQVCSQRESASGQALKRLRQIHNATSSLLLKSCCIVLFCFSSLRHQLMDTSSRRDYDLDQSSAFNGAKPGHRLHRLGITNNSGSRAPHRAPCSWCTTTLVPDINPSPVARPHLSLHSNFNRVALRGHHGSEDQVSRLGRPEHSSSQRTILDSARVEWIRENGIVQS